MSDERVQINLEGISALGRHGVFDFERNQPQTFIADAELVADVDTSSDELEGTVDYGAAALVIHQRLAGEPVNLIETLAARIADDLLGLPRVRQVSVTVHKPHAPVQTPSLTYR